MSRTGRPRRPDSKRRTYFGRTRFNPDEADIVIRAALAAGVSVCRFLREAAISVAEKAQSSASCAKVNL